MRLKKRLLAFSFFFNDTAPTEIYTLSLHDALPICPSGCHGRPRGRALRRGAGRSLGSSGGYHRWGRGPLDRKSTRLNSSHQIISYAVVCLLKNQKELTKMQLDNQKEIAEMQNETQKEIAGIQFFF